MKPETTLAERCYASSATEDELFEAVNVVLGCDTKECGTDESFVWGAIDTWWDPYDGSVEVVRPPGSEAMTREQADAILAFGFDRIYESLGDKARTWTKSGGGECRPREGGEVRRLRSRLRSVGASPGRAAQLEETIKQNDEIHREALLVVNTQLQAVIKAADAMRDAFIRELNNPADQGCSSTIAPYELAKLGAHIQPAAPDNVDDVLRLLDERIAVHERDSSDPEYLEGLRDARSILQRRLTDTGGWPLPPLHLPDQKIHTELVDHHAEMRRQISNDGPVGLSPNNPIIID